MKSPIPRLTSIHRVVLTLGLVCLLATLAGIILVQANSGEAAVPNDATARTRIAEGFGKLPLSFEINKGQLDRSVKFLSHGTGYDLFLTSTEAVLRLQKLRPSHTDKPQETPSANANVREGTVLRLRMLDSNAAPKAEGEEELPGKVNYFIGNDHANWHRNVPTYKKVRFENVYPGIDVVYYGKQRELEFDYVIAPGA